MKNRRLRLGPADRALSIALVLGFAACEDPAPSDPIGPVARDAGTGDAEPGDVGARPDVGPSFQGELRVSQDGTRVDTATGAFDFGRVLVGSVGAGYAFTLENAGRGPLEVRSATVAGGDRASFAVEDLEPQVLPAGTSTSFQLRFEPERAGVIAGWLEVESGDPDGLARVDLVGEGVRREDLPADTNGTWTSTTFIAYDTREARIVVRVGDIDNLGFGFPSGFDPFSGDSTRPHAYPFTPDPEDPPGTDRIMVVSSYDGRPPAGRDGYTQTTSRPENLPQPVTLRYDLRGSVPRSAVLQLFVDDFQAPVWRASYQARVDGERARFIEEVLQTLVQTGPIGKLITLPFPPELVPTLEDGALEIAIDDPTTGAGDGFAIDFAKLFIDVYGFENTGTITGVVTDATTGGPLAEATVSASGFVTTRTAFDGSYTLSEVPAGFVFLRVTRSGYRSNERLLDLRTDQTLAQDVALEAE